MKKISIIAFLACAFINTACENDDTLNETRLPDVTPASVSLSSVTVNKYDATFVVNVNEIGNPAIREYGILVSTEAQPTIANSTIMVAEGNESSATLVGSFSPGTTYYACAYALTANKMEVSGVESFETAPHKLGAFLGSKTLSGLNLHAGGTTSIAVTIAPDEEDESIAYLSGLSSNAGVQLALGKIKLVFDLEAGTVTIPAEQIVQEGQYGNYLYGGIDANNQPVIDAVVGTISDGVISFNSLCAVIVAGGNAGLFHWAYKNITIQ